MVQTRLGYVGLSEKVEEDSAVEACNTRRSGNESLKLRREEIELIDGDIIVVGELVEGEYGSNDDLRFSELSGLGGLVDEIGEASGVGFNDRIKSSYSNNNKFSEQVDNKGTKRTSQRMYHQQRRHPLQHVALEPDHRTGCRRC